MGAYFGAKGRGKIVISWSNYNLNNTEEDQ